MDIEFFCSHCGQSLVIDDSGAGTTVDCPKCGKPVYVPSKPVSQPVPVPSPTIPPPHTGTKKPIGPLSRPLLTSRPTAAPVTLPGHNLALSAGESVILQARMHGIVVALPAIGVVIVCIFFGVVDAVFQHLMQAFIGRGVILPGIFLLPCIPFLFLGAVGTLLAWLARSHTLITLTNRRLIINQGILSKTTAELLLKQIETVAIRLPLLGRIFGYGTLVVRGTGGGVFALKFLENTDQLYSKLQGALQISK
jgi:DNA-directed RNA polymerase subunit RPC12/RpoP